MKKIAFLMLMVLVTVASPRSWANSIIIMGEMTTPQSWIDAKCGTLRELALHSNFQCIGYQELLKNPSIQATYTLLIEIQELPDGNNLVRYNRNLVRKHVGQWVQLSNDSAAFFIEKLILDDTRNDGPVIEEKSLSHFEKQTFQSPARAGYQVKKLGSFASIPIRKNTRLEFNYESPKEQPTITYPGTSSINNRAVTGTLKIIW